MFPAQCQKLSLNTASCACSCAYGRSVAGLGPYTTTDPNIKEC